MNLTSTNVVSAGTSSRRTNGRALAIDRALPVPAFAKRLSKARHMRGLSQIQLASKAGLQQVSISLFETGRRSPSLGNLKRLADALEVTSDYLMGRSGFPEMSNVAISHLIRDEQKLSSDDVRFLEQVAASLGRSKSG